MAQNPEGVVLLPFYPIKQILLVIFNFKLFQKIKVFFPERLFSMMLFLIFYISIQVFELGMCIRKGSISTLPGKFSF